MRLHRIAGVCPVVETPFTPDEEVDVISLRRLLGHVRGAGVRQVMVPAFASEYYKLDDAERQLVTATVIDEMHATDGTIVVVSVPDHATHLAVARARQARAAGADMINILPPHLHQPTPQAVQEHVEAILEAVPDVPAILQHAPVETGSSLPVTTVAAITDAHPNLVQVKVESAPPGAYISALADAAPRLECVVGHAGLHYIDALRRGAVGLQPGISFAELYLRLDDHWRAGRHEEAIRLYDRLLPYLAYWMQHIELIVAAEKRISWLRGLIATPVCRSPRWTLDDHELAMVDRFLDDFSRELT